MSGIGCSIFKAIEIEVMAHSLTVAAAAAASATTAISGMGSSELGHCKSKSSNCCLSFPIITVWAVAGHHYHQACGSHEGLPHHHSVSVPRRTLIMSGTMLLGLSLSEHGRNACAAARRPPPPPPPEVKKDPNVSGVQAKVLASKKRKEALKKTVAKLREKGNLIKQPP